MTGSEQAANEYFEFTERRIATQMCKLVKITRAGTTGRDIFSISHASGGWGAVRDARHQLAD